MRTPAILQKSLLSIESVQLGRFVTNAMEPQQDFVDPAVGPQPNEIIVKPQKDFKEILNHSQNSNVRSRLTALLSISYQRQGTGTTTLIAEKATTYKLLNSREWFMKACAQPRTRTWFEACLQYTEDVYLVVGFYTLTNPSSIQKSTFGALIGGGFQTPDLAGGAVARPVQDMISARVNSAREVTNHHECTFSGSGEQIYAIQYRKLKFSWFSSRNIEKSCLERDNRWKVFWDPGIRGEESDEEEEDDLLEVDFTDDFDLGFDEVYVSEDGIEEQMD
ncbi:hypothetical protein Q9L58_009321 [Maublancomyces gigas]|uniref:Uncharacterized protein n=1 Tax=Discina gigas TaxID=1032678 RepID=A0ABR3G8A7_9PEZI